MFTYGVLPEHYPLVRDVVCATFEQFLGSEWTSELKKAWLDAYATFSEMMLERFYLTQPMSCSQIIVKK